ncbi:MAG: 1,4-dihydroxy-2-naphthoate octaprenyltransferase, partial [Deltaproteobacteria bacterium CG_4_10_14_0_2_um_filter_43_8]
AINNLRDVEGDAKAGRKTFPIRFGIKAAKIEILFFLFLPFVLLFFWSDKWLMLCWLSFPLAAHLALQVWKTSPSPRYNIFLGRAALLHLLFGLLFSGGLLLS